MTCSETSPAGDLCVSVEPGHNNTDPFRVHIAHTRDSSLVKLWGQTKGGGFFTEISTLEREQAKGRIQ